MLKWKLNQKIECDHKWKPIWLDTPKLSWNHARKLKWKHKWNQALSVTFNRWHQVSEIHAWNCALKLLSSSNMTRTRWSHEMFLLDSCKSSPNYQNSSISANIPHVNAIRLWHHRVFISTTHNTCNIAVVAWSSTPTFDPISSAPFRCIHSTNTSVLHVRISYSNNTTVSSLTISLHLHQHNNNLVYLRLIVVGAADPNAWLIIASSSSRLWSTYNLWRSACNVSCSSKAAIIPSTARTQAIPRVCDVLVCNTIAVQLLGGLNL